MSTWATLGKFPTEPGIVETKKASVQNVTANYQLPMEEQKNSPEEFAQRYARL